MRLWVGLPSDWDWVTIPSMFRLVSFNSFPFHSVTSSYYLVVGVRSWKAGMDYKIPLYFSSRSFVFMMRRIDFWRWLSMPLSIQWRRLGFSRTFMIHKIGQNTLNPLWSWCDNCSTSAALALSSTHCWAFDIGCNPTGGVACQERYNIRVHSLVTHTKQWHAACDDVGRDTLGNLQGMLLNSVYNAEVAIFTGYYVIPALGTGIVLNGQTLEYPPEFLV